MAMFMAYFDASGHRTGHGKAPAMYVAGCVASVDKWIEFETKWAALLREFDITVPFHMTDFMAGQGKFRGWVGGDSRRKEFQLAAARILQRSTDKPFAIGLVVSDLEWFFERYVIPPSEPKSPYAWCSLFAFEHVALWLPNRVTRHRLHEKADVEIVFEHGDPNQGEFRDALWAKHKLEVNFRTNHGKKLAPFAAADFLGWVLRKWVSTRAVGLMALEQSKAPFLTQKGKREAMQRAANLLQPNDVVTEIARILPTDALGMMNQDSLARLAKEKGWPERR